jgi:hypothetical protein
MKKTAEELEEMGKRLRAEGKFVPLVHGPRDILFWEKQQIPFVRSEFYKDIWPLSGGRYGR